MPGVQDEDDEGDFLNDISSSSAADSEEERELVYRRRRREKDKKRVIYGVFLDEDGDGRRRKRRKNNKNRGPISSDEEESLEESLDADFFYRNIQPDEPTAGAGITFVSSTKKKASQEQARPPTPPGPPSVSLVEGFSSPSSSSDDEEEDEEGAAEELKASDIFRRKGLGATGTSPQSASNSATSGAPSAFEKHYGIGYRLISQMGYTGTGGLGKEGQGRIESIIVKRRTKNRGLQEVGERAPSPKPISKSFINTRNRGKSSAKSAQTGDNSTAAGGEDFPTKSDWTAGGFDSTLRDRRKNEAESVRVRRLKREALKSKYNEEIRELEGLDQSQAGRIIDLRGQDVRVYDASEIDKVWKDGGWKEEAPEDDLRGEEEESSAKEEDEVALVREVVPEPLRPKKVITIDDIDSKFAAGEIDAAKLTRLEHVQSVVQKCLSKLPSQADQQTKSIIDKYCGEASTSYTSWDEDDIQSFSTYPPPTKASADIVSSEESKDKPLDMNGLTQIFRELRRDYAAEIRRLDLKSSIVSELLVPILQAEAEKWDWQNHPHKFQKANLLFWRSFLKVDEEGDRQSSSQCDKLCKVILSAVASPVLAPFFEYKWDPQKDAEVAFSICNDWLRLWLSTKDYLFFLEDVVAQRLKVEAEEWNPASTAQPPHLWLLPWLEALPSDSVWQPIWGVIAKKCREALQQWTPLDRSASQILLPWKVPWSLTYWKGIVSSLWDQIDIWLGKVDAVFTKDVPEVLETMMEDWKGELTAERLVKSLDKYYIGRVLFQLEENSVLILDSEEGPVATMEAHRAWKGLNSNKLNNDQYIHKKFIQVAMAIVRKKLLERQPAGCSSVSAPPPAVPPPPCPPSSGSKGEQSSKRAQSTKPKQPNDPGGSYGQKVVLTTLLDVLGTKAAALSMTMLPVRDRYERGRQVYRLNDRITLYCDTTNELIYVGSASEGWHSASIPETIELAQRKRN